MFSIFGIERRDLQHILVHLLSLVLTTFILGIITNLFSSLIEKFVNYNPVTIFILVFLLLATLSLIVMLEWQFTEAKRNPNRPPAPQTYEYGTTLSLSFFVLLLFKGCDGLQSISPWTIIGAGSLPLIIGKFMLYSYQNKVHSRTPPSARAPQQEPPQNIPSEDQNIYPGRVSIKSAMEGVPNIDHQPGIILIIIETILSIRETVTQLDIVRACKKIAKFSLLPYGFEETIRDFMAKFVNIRQGRRKVILYTENKNDWKIVEYASE